MLPWVPPWELYNIHITDMDPGKSMSSRRSKGDARPPSYYRENASRVKHEEDKSTGGKLIDMTGKGTSDSSQGPNGRGSGMR